MPYPKNNGWFADWYDSDGRRKRKFFPTKRQAEAFEAKQRILTYENRNFEVVKNENISLKDFLNIYLENHSKPNKKSYISDLRKSKPLIAELGDKLISKIGLLDVEQYKNKRIQKLSPATVNRELALLKSALNKASLWQYLQKSRIDLRQIKLYKENNQRTRHLSQEELGSLLAHCNPKLKSTVQILVNTGMRCGELRNLEWANLDFSKNLIHIKDSKSGEGRFIPMNNKTKFAFLWLREHVKGSLKVVPENFRGAFERAIGKAKIKDFRMHDLRHTFASNLMMRGVNLNTVRELLGHKSMKMTIRYAHLSPDFKARAVQLLDTTMDTNQETSDNLSKTKVVNHLAAS